MKIKGNFKSLKFVLSVMVTVVIFAVLAVMISVIRSTVVNLARDSYLNQMHNVNEQIEQRLVYFFETEVKNAQFIAANPLVRDAVKGKNFTSVRPFLKALFDKKGIYEQVFLSSPEQNSRIYVSADGKADGVQWGNIPVYTENARQALDGKVHLSDAGKSPVTGLTVILVTVPIMEGKSVIGIVGLPVDVGTFSVQIVQNIHIGKTGYAYITDSTGVTLAHPDKTLIHKMKIGDFDWGKKILTSKKSDAEIYFSWKGVDKVQTFRKNKTYGFITGATMGVDDYMGEIHARDAFLFPMALFFVALAAFVVYGFMKRRLGTLEECKAVMNAVATGDLTKRYTGKISNDEIGDMASSINESIGRFEQLLSQMVFAATSLSEAVEQIAAGNENLSQRTAEQASSLEEIASTIEQAAASINQNAENSSRAKELTNKGAEMSDDGNKVAREAVMAINDINDSSKKISDIIAVINEIAFQTNLLALNAAVEAARAGDHGKGFAVVAGEVRNLSQRSSTAANEIEELIKDSVSKVENGTELVGKTGDVLAEISRAAKTTANLISEIAASSHEQKNGMEQINTAIVEMDSMTQDNASLVEETAAASEELSNQAEELMTMVRQFTISGDPLKRGSVRKSPKMHVKQNEKPGDSGNAKAGVPSNGNGNGRKGNGNGKHHYESVVAYAETMIQRPAEKGNMKEALLKEGYEEF